MISLHSLRPGFLIAALFYSLGLIFFYVRYVPLVRPLQVILVPILAIVCLTTALKPLWGTLFFVFSFPLINNLPYFFGIHESTPHAPTALVLFLFFFLGWLIQESRRPAGTPVKKAIFFPATFFALTVLLSAVLTIFRLANFYPFRSNGIYELATNVKGVSAGGAIMSTLFGSLNYLTGLALFYVLLRLFKSSALVKKTAWILVTSTLISLAFGLWQHFVNIRFGNTLRGIDQGMINGTFKDPLSFGAYVAIIGPVILGTGLASKAAGQIVALFTLILSGAMTLFIGSRSGLVAFFISLGIFMALSFRTIISKKPLNILAPIAFLVAVFGLALIFSQGDLSRALTVTRMDVPLKKEIMHFDSAPRGRLWAMALSMIGDYPLTGVGIGNYIIEVSNYSARHGVLIINPQSAENVFLQVGSELGLVGIFLSLWILWEILKEIRRSYLGFPKDKKNQFVLFGAFAGLLAFFLNAQVHTFIGSYEIIYAFWLLVAFVFCLNEKEARSESAVRPRKRLAGAMAGILAVFGCVHLWNSTHSLSLEAHTQEFGLKQSFGVYREETTAEGETFSWSGRAAGLTLKVEKPVMQISIYASHPDIQENPVKVRIYLIKNLFKQKMLLDEIALNDSRWRTLSYHLPQEIGQEVLLLIKVSRTWNPQKTRGVPDPRNLGVAIRPIVFTDAANPTAAPKVP